MVFSDIEGWSVPWNIIVRSKSVANPWRNPKIAVLAAQKAAKSWIHLLRGQ
jgi:hypothetical protein